MYISVCQKSSREVSEGAHALRCSIDFGDMCGEIAEKAELFLPYTELRPEGLCPDGKAVRAQSRNKQRSAKLQLKKVAAATF